jgi:hypothetical protein
MPRQAEPGTTASRAPGKRRHLFTVADKGSRRKPAQQSGLGFLDTVTDAAVGVRFGRTLAVAGGSAAISDNPVRTKNVPYFGWLPRRINGFGSCSVLRRDGAEHSAQKACQSNASSAERLLRRCEGGKWARELLSHFFHLCLRPLAHLRAPGKRCSQMPRGKRERPRLSVARTLMPHLTALRRRPRHRPE